MVLHRHPRFDDTLGCNALDFPIRKVWLVSKYRQEIVTDLFVSLSGWYSDDSRAPVGVEGETASPNDYEMVTTLGWVF